MPSPIGANAGYLPKVTTGLIVGYGRNANDFAVNKLTKLHLVDRQIGRFPKLRPQEAARLLDPAFRRWADGGNRPVSDFNKDVWDWISYETVRYAEAIPLGYLGVEQADFPVIEAQAQSLAMRAMLARSIDMWTILTTGGTYLSGLTDTATNWGGGAWSAATTANRYIQKGIAAIVTAIEKATNGAVSYDSLTMVMSPTVAYKVAASQEVAEGLIQSPFAREQLEGAKWHLNYGLPAKLYGVNVVVDNAVKVTTGPNSAGTATAAYTGSATDVYFVARPGELVNNTGVASDFCSIANFVFKGEEMVSEVIDDPFNARKVVSVKDNYQMKVLAQETLARVTAAVS